MSNRFFSKETRNPPPILTVIVSDPSPFVHLQESPAYRTVRLRLTDKQVEELQLRCTGNQGGVRIYEHIARCFLEHDA